MGVSAVAMLSIGILFPDDYVLPWDEVGKNLDDWWRDVRGYVPTFYPYDEEGYYKSGIGPGSEEVEAYFAEKRKWDEENPLPVELVPFGREDDNESYLLAVVGTLQTAYSGSPEEVRIPEMSEVRDATVKLLEFCQEFGLEGTPRWYLSSYLG